jgi:hypothetical protein
LTVPINVVTDVLEEQKFLLKVEAAGSSETLVIIYHITSQKTGKFIATVTRTSDVRCRNPENHNSVFGTLRISDLM